LRGKEFNRRLDEKVSANQARAGPSRKCHPVSGLLWKGEPRADLGKGTVFMEEKEKKS